MLSITVDFSVGVLVFPRVSVYVMDFLALFLSTSWRSSPDTNLPLFLHLFLDGQYPFVLSLYWLYIIC